MTPMRGMLAKADLTEQQWRVLRVLREEGPMDPTSISHRAVLLLPSLTRILTRLEDKELVTRGRDTRDKRRQVIEITTSGAELIDQNVESSNAILDDFRNRMGERRFDELVELLDALNDL